MEDRGDWSEARDLERLRERRPEAVRAWFSSYFAVVHGFVSRRVASCPSLADDVTQDTFLAALRQIHEFDPARGAMLPWLTYIARNCARKALRGARLSNSVSRDAVDLGNYPDLASVTLPEEILDRAETADLVHAALSALAPHHQRALESHYLLEQPLTQMAAAEATTLAAMKSLLHRARQAFKTAFEAAAESAARGTTGRGPVEGRPYETTKEDVHGC